MSEEQKMETENEFASLRLSEEAFTKYQRASDVAFRLPLDRREASSQQIKVVGYGEDATAAIKASNSDGKDYLMVPWGPVDSMLWIMQRLEAQLRIPLQVWRLAGDGMVLDPSLLVAGHSVFRQDNIELFLVPGNMMDDYLSKNQKEHVWKRLIPGTTESSDYLEKARATFHLLTPKPPKAWEMYYEQRTKADRTFEGMLYQYAGEEMDPILEQIRDGLNDTLEDIDITAEQRRVIADGVVPLRFDVLDDEGDVYEAKIMTRFYSPTKPAAVDVYFTYHHRTRWESVDFDCRLMYRIHDPINTTDLRMSLPGTTLRGEKSYWGLIFEQGLADLPPGRRWRAIDQNEWGLEEAALDRIHAALFDTQERSPVKEIDKVHTVRLLMATVGLSFGVARTEDDHDTLDPANVSDIRWELNDEEWIGLNIRKVCGVPLQKDASYKPRPVDDEDPYEDDEDDEDDDEDGYDDL